MKKKIEKATGILCIYVIFPLLLLGAVSFLPGKIGIAVIAIAIGLLLAFVNHLLRRTFVSCPEIEVVDTNNKVLMDYISTYKQLLDGLLRDKEKKDKEILELTERVTRLEKKLECGKALEKNEGPVRETSPNRGEDKKQSRTKGKETAGITSQTKGKEMADITSQAKGREADSIPSQAKGRETDSTESLDQGREPARTQSRVMAGESYNDVNLDKLREPDKAKGQDGKEAVDREEKKNIQYDGGLENVPLDEIEPLKELSGNDMKKPQGFRVKVDTEGLRVKTELTAGDKLTVYREGTGIYWLNGFGELLPNIFEIGGIFTQELHQAFKDYNMEKIFSLNGKYVIGSKITGIDKAEFYMLEGWEEQEEQFEVTLKKKGRIEVDNSALRSADNQ